MTNDRPTRAGVLALVAAFLGWLFDGFEMGLFPIIARPALRSLAPEIADDAFVGSWMGIVTALFLLGAAGGGLVFGWLGDRIGRVRAMSASILTYSLFTGLGYFVAEPWQLGALRFVAALGMGGEWSLGVALVMETWPERHRPWLAGAIGAAANVGFLLVALVAKLFPVTVDSWRFMMLVGASPALLVFLIRLFVPESKKWKESVGAARARPVREVFAPALRPRVVVAALLASVALVGTWASVQWIPLWVDQMTGGRDPGAKAVAQMAYGLGAILGSFVGPVIGGRLPRRWTYFGLCAVSFAACAVQFRVLHEYSASFVAMTVVTSAATASFYGWLPLYLPELFPTRVRATGQGVAFNAGRVFAAAGALLGGQLVAAFDGSFPRAAATVTLVYVAGMALAFMAPETRGRALPA